MSEDKDNKHVEPTQPAYYDPYMLYQDSYNVPPYETTTPIYDGGQPLIAPPPPLPKQHHILRWAIIITVIVLIVASSSYVGYIIASAKNNQSTTNKPLIKSTQPMSAPTLSTKTTIVITSTHVTTTVAPTVTSTAQTIPSSTLTANELYQDFVNASMGIASPTEISNSWWLSIGESYYPARGGVQFTDTNSNTLLQIAVFNAAQAATTDAQEATSSPNGWAAQTIQVNTCVLFSSAGPIDIQYYKPTMQQFCI